MKKQLIRISIWQSSKVVTALYFIMGFLYAVIGIPMIMFGGRDMLVMGVIYTVMPLLMAVFGFVFFVAFAALYNVLARWFGGVEFEIREGG